MFVITSSFRTSIHEQRAKRRMHRAQPHLAHLHRAAHRPCNRRAPDLHSCSTRSQEFVSRRRSRRGSVENGGSMQLQLIRASAHSLFLVFSFLGIPRQLAFSCASIFLRHTSQAILRAYLGFTVAFSWNRQWPGEYWTTSDVLS